MTHTEAVCNQYVMVGYDFERDMVVVSKLPSFPSIPEKILSGWPLCDNWKAFVEGFSDNVTYDDAINFFTPNINIYENAKQ